MKIEMAAFAAAPAGRPVGKEAFTSLRQESLSASQRREKQSATLACR
jgi:hypothetical protein